MPGFLYVDNSLTGVYGGCSISISRALGLLTNSDTMDKLLGTCQICERGIKRVEAKGFNQKILAHHGYQRPGDGWQTASCFGARQLPYERSRDQIRPCIDLIENFVKLEKSRLAELRTNPPATLRESVEYMTVRELKTYDRPEGFDPVKNEENRNYNRDGYAYEHSKRVYKHSRNIQKAQVDVNRLQKRFDNWVAVALD